MSHGKKVHWLAMAAAACLVAAGPTTAPDDAADAPRTDASLSAAPPLKAAVIPTLMTADAYHEQFGKVAAEFDPPPAAKELYTAGVVVMAINPAAAANDLKFGDVVVAVDGTGVHNPADFDKARDEGKAQTLLVCRGLAAAAKPVKVEAGQLGLTLAPYTLLANEYLKTLAAGEKPSAELRLAAVKLQTDPPLSYAALAAARAQKLTGTSAAWLDEITALALFSDNRYEGALTAAAAAVGRAPSSQRPLLIRVEVVSALATGRFDLAKKLAASADAKTAALVPAVKLEAEIAKLADKAKKPRPNPAAADLDFKDRVADLVNTAPDANNEKQSSQTRVDAWQRDGNIAFSAPGSSYDVCICGPDAENVKFTADCHFADTDHRPTKFVRVVRVGVTSDDGFNREIELYDDGSANVQSIDGKPIAPLYVGRITGGDRTFKLQMVVAGGRYEFDLDGRRVGYGCMPPTADGSPRKYALSIQTVGVTGEFHDAHWLTADSK